MARKILQETTYTFAPATRTITLPRYLPRERLILITNVTTNQVIYNFSDTTLTATSYTATGGQATPGVANGLTTIVLSFNTSSMAASDKLQFLIDDFEERMIPAETYIDPANKFRVSTPQSMIDTDFELSLQSTKWEFFQAQNGMQSAFARPTDTPLQPVFAGLGYSLISQSVSVTGGTATVSGLSLPTAPVAGSFVYIVDAVSSSNFSAVRYAINSGASTSSFSFNLSLGNGTYTPQIMVLGTVAGTSSNPSYAVFSVTNEISTGTGAVSAGSPIFVQDTFDENTADGTFTVAFVATGTRSFAYLPKSTTANINILQRPNTVAYVGAYYGSYAASSNIPVNSVTSDGARTMTVVTTTAHGLTVGSPIFVNNTTQVNANGPWYVLGVQSPTQFTYATLNTVTAGAITQATTLLYLRPEGNQTHRPGDGGVQITPGNNVVGAQAVRQTRRYFRYQSGKGLQFSTAFTFKPNYDITSVTVSGTTMVITCDQDHGLKPGAVIRISGLTATNSTDQGVYNNTFVVAASGTITAKAFTVILSAATTDTNPGGQVPTVEVVEAKGYAARAGLFDEQNGMFWEYNGQSLNVVRRNATAVLRGIVNVCTGSSLVLGDGTARFTKQLVVGDRIVIRGQTYQIARIISDNAMDIAPTYRAATPSTAQGTSGIPYSTLTAASSQTQTINIQTSTTASQIQSATSTGGAAAAFSFGVTINRLAGGGGNPTANGTSGASQITSVSNVSGIVPGMLVINANLPVNTFVDNSYVVGTSTIPLTNRLRATVTGGTFEFYRVPSPGMNVSGTGLATGTQVSNILGTTTGGATTALTIFISAPMTAGATGTYTFGNIPADVATTVISLASTAGIAPGMLITGTNVPGNCIVAAIQPYGTAIVLNAAINQASAITDGTTLTFTTQHGLVANSVNTGGATTSSGVSTVTMATTVGISVGSFITSATPAQFFPIGTYVTSVNRTTNVITTSANTSTSIPGATTLVFGSRVFVTGSTQLLANGQWPVSSVTSTTITYQTTSTVPTSSTISTFGVTRIFGEDLIARKFIVRELRIPQDQFNIDRLDGTGPSGFNIDPTKMQMIFMDYTWYGAGFVRYGVRATGGDVIYCHKIQNGNNQYQAYLRSGNLPGRFELNNVGANSYLTTDIASTGLTITPNAPGTVTVFDASQYFAPFTGALGEGKNGEVLIDNEYFFYTGLATTTGNTPWGNISSVATLGTPVVSSGVLTSIPVTSGGSGYTAPPPIVIAGVGGGAKAIANVVNGSVVSVTVTSGGTGYTSTPVVYIGPNQLTGVVRENNAFTVGAMTGTPTTTNGSTRIQNVSNAASFYVGQILAANAAFNNVPVRITAVSGTDVYVDTPAVTGGVISISSLLKGSSSAVAHYAPNNASLPVSSVLNTTQLIAPAAQHWGVSVMMDGRFDSDKSYVFTTPRQTAAVINLNTTAPLLSIRVSPSVSLGFARNFGVRDIINRMQMNLYSMDVYTSGTFLITVRYNCNSTIFQPALWAANAVGSGSLAQVIYHTPGDIVTGGDTVVAFYATNAGSGVFATTQQDLTIVKDLGNSVIGGDAVYPDGPDVITVFATNLSTSAAAPIYSRISWTEAQA